MSATLVRYDAFGRPALNGTVPEWMGQRSRLLHYLPAIFSEGEESDFLARYLLIFETIINQLDQVIHGLADYFRSDTTPEEFLPWLASWVGLTLESGWPVERRRAVLARAIELHRWRGTIRGLREHLSLYTGYLPEIVERGSGLTLGKDVKLGQQTVLGKSDHPTHFSVVLRVPDASQFEREKLRAIIEAQRPAHTTYALFVVEDEDAEPVELPEYDNQIAPSADAEAPDEGGSAS